MDPHIYLKLMKVEQMMDQDRAKMSTYQSIYHHNICHFYKYCNLLEQSSKEFYRKKSQNLYQVPCYILQLYQRSSKFYLLKDCDILSKIRPSGFYYLRLMHNHYFFQCQMFHKKIFSQLLWVYFKKVQEYRYCINSHLLNLYTRT